MYTLKGPEGEGASAFLRFSIPNIDRLSILVNNTNLNDQDILEGLESLVLYTIVILQSSLCVKILVESS